MFCLTLSRATVQYCAATIMPLFLILPLTFLESTTHRQFPEAVYKERFPETLIPHNTTMIANVLDAKNIKVLMITASGN